MYIASSSIELRRRDVLHLPRLVVVGAAPPLLPLLAPAAPLPEEAGDVAARALLLVAGPLHRGGALHLQCHARSGPREPHEVHRVPKYLVL
jgi:hypothetical protein